MTETEQSFTRRVLIQFAHPMLHKSRVNRQLLAAVTDLPGVTVNDLYAAYPDGDIQVDEEQELMESHDICVFQHPLYWYSTPPMVKEWLDLVLEHGWSHGHDATALEGKKVLLTVTTGGSEEAYQHEGYNRHPLSAFLLPLEQSFRLCRMEVIPPFVVHGTHLLDDVAIAQHAADYRKVIIGLRDGTIDLRVAHEHPRLNTDLPRVLGNGGNDDAQ